MVWRASVKWAFPLWVPVAESIVGEGNLETAPSSPHLSDTRCVFEKTAVSRLRRLWLVRRYASVTTFRRKAVEI